MRALIIVGPSGVGKGTVISHLISRSNALELTVSYTTRAQRAGQIDGKHYHFISHRLFQEKVKNNEMMEHKHVFGNYYGTSRLSFTDIIARGKRPVLDIDRKGMLDIVSSISHQQQDGLKVPVVLCLLPPSLSILEDRLTGRKSQSAEVVQKRMEENVEQIQQLLKLRGKHIFFTTNYQYQMTVHGIERLLHKEIIAKS